MKTPHKHAELIKAWADGAKIECKNPLAIAWSSVSTPQWLVDVEYRIKPEPKPDRIETRWLAYNPDIELVMVFKDTGRVKRHCKEVEFIFDGETNLLKSMRLL